MLLVLSVNAAPSGGFFNHPSRLPGYLSALLATKISSTVGDYHLEFTITCCFCKGSLRSMTTPAGISFLQPTIYSLSSKKQCIKFFFTGNVLPPHFSHVLRVGLVPMPSASCGA